jgi:hypothetical protein
MNTIHQATTRLRSRCAGAACAGTLTLAVAATLAACGGTHDDTADAAASPSVSAKASPSASPSAAPSASPITSTIAPLFDDRARPLLSPRSAMPADIAARTRQGLYASREQLEWQELTVGIVSIVLDVDAEGGVEATVHRARMLRAWHGHDGKGRVYYVRARDLSAAVRVVDTLSDEGFGWVYMVH